MKDANLMTPEQLRKLADEKEASNKPCKMGFLKHDMYEFYDEKYPRPKYMKCTKENKDKIIQEFSEKFEKIAEKGAKFVCYKDEERARIAGTEYLWYDENGFFEEMDDEWAKENLDNIVDIT